MQVTWKHNVPEHFLVETQIESDTLGAAFLIRGSNGGEFTVPRLAALIPTGHLKKKWIPSTTLPFLCQIGSYTNYNSPALQSLGWSPCSGQNWIYLRHPVEKTWSKEKFKSVFISSPKVLPGRRQQGETDLDKQLAASVAQQLMKSNLHLERWPLPLDKQVLAHKHTQEWIIVGVR